MIIGTQKSGTSSLFNILRTHPRIRTAKKKELLWFTGNFEKVRCDPPETAPSDADFQTYLRKFPVLDEGSRQLMGEFSATYMHCWCCPAAMQRLMPGLRLVTQLRDPIERARSRWTEQHSWAKKIETHSSFEEYVAHELPKLKLCVEGAAGSLETETHCAARSNILGLSLYDSAIALWLRHYRPEDLLVLFLEQLAASPQSVASAVHLHLGIEDRQYNNSLLHARFNEKGHYGWKKTAALATLQTGNGTSMVELYNFYRPHMERLKGMADQGLISKLPASWIARWHL